MRNIILVTTGGTIASTSDGSGAKVASVPGRALAPGAGLPTGVHVEVVEALRRNSYALAPADLDRIAATVRSALRSADVDGVVVTHGTDTLEESAMLLDLLHADERPVVLTGAQRSHDDPAADGPRNLRDAVALAADPAARGLGVLVCFDGLVHAARGARKSHTSDDDAFADPDVGALGVVGPGGRVILHRRTPPARVPLPVGTRLADVRVDLVAAYPGADAVALDAFVEHGARGIVLVGTGYGNATPALVDGVRRCVARGVTVVVSTRVHGGEVRPVYGGGGGGVDLVAAGAVPAGLLRPGQARILLGALLASGHDHAAVARAFTPATPPARAPDPTGTTPTPVLVPTPHPVRGDTDE